MRWFEVEEVLNVYAVGVGGARPRDGSDSNATATDVARQRKTPVKPGMVPRYEADAFPRKVRLVDL